MHLLATLLSAFCLVFLVSRPCHARERRVSSPPSRSNDFKDDLDFSSAGHGSSRFSNEYDPCPHLPLEGQKEGEEEDDDKCRGFLRGRPRATSASISSDEDLFLENQVAGGHSAEVSSSLPFDAIGGERSQVKRSRRKRRNTDDERGERERSEGEEEEEMDERMEIIEKDVAEEIERNLSENLRVTRSEVDLEGEGQKLCRSGMKLLPPDLYEADTCALCYHYMRNTDLFVNKWKSVDAERNSWEGDTTRVYTINVLETPEGSLVEANVSSETQLSSFKVEEGREKWRTCCRAAVSCCRQMMDEPQPAGYCPSTWDGWQCWPATPPGVEAKRPCPPYVYFGKPSSCPKMATKQCTASGTWFSITERDGRLREWSNYSSCGDPDKISSRLYVHITAYSISVAALLPALCIFMSYKQLRVHRITLHKHLFISLLLEATSVISLKLLQLRRNDLIERNPAWCIGLNLLTKYTSLSNYMWYLCEGYYLHKLLASAFAEQNSLVVFYLIGWVFPLLPLSIYVGVRAYWKGNKNCWILPMDDLDWIINLPPLLALLINVVFVVNIIRILVGIMRAPNANEPTQYRKAVRATMMVVPLVGLQYVVTIYRPRAKGCDWLNVYQILNSIIEGSTGAVVALIYCYTNGEVCALLARSFQRYHAQRKIGGSSRGGPRAGEQQNSTLTTLQPNERPRDRAKQQQV